MYVLNWHIYPPDYHSRKGNDLWFEELDEAMEALHDLGADTELWVEVGVDMLGDGDINWFSDRHVVTHGDW